MAIKIRFRRDTAANWTTANPILDQGEVGVETDTLKLKMGDGATAWGSLSYLAVDGVDGRDGEQWFTGAGTPGAGTGQDGDFYLDTGNGDVYEKAAGAWGSAIMNLTGPAGPAGAAGADGAGAPEAVAQTGHGFAVGDPIRHNGTSYVKSTADTEANAVVAGIVVIVTDANNFTMQTVGKVTSLTALTGGSVYYLQDAGGIGTTAGTVKKPVVLAISATDGYLLAIGSGASGGGGGGGSGRTLLTANLNLYVATTGSDANDGLTAGAPFLTIQKALNVASQDYDLQGFDIIINIADGSYAENLSLKTTTGGGKVKFTGNVTTPANVILAPASGTAVSVALGDVRDATVYSFEGMKFAPASGTNVFFIHATTVEIENVDFAGVGAGHHAVVEHGAIFVIKGDYTVSGGANAHLWARYGGMVQFSGAVTVTFSGSPAWGVMGWYSAWGGIFIAEPSITNSGTVTGKKYQVEYNGVLNGSSKAPGSTAGSTATGGQAAG